jgi:hypothetical protein
MALRVLALAAALAAATLALAGAAGAETDTYGGIAFSPFTIDAGNDACVPRYEPDAGPTRNCDPINLIFPGQSVSEVVARLSTADWTLTGGTVQWLRFASPLRIPVDAQLGFPDGRDPTERYHVRLWQAGPSLTVGNVHHEHGSPHQIDLAWDQAEAFVANGLCTGWCELVRLPLQAAIEAGPLWRGWANDAYATVIPVAPPPTAAAAPPSTQPAVHKRKKHRRHRPGT